jgi:hypothetical protein
MKTTLTLALALLVPIAARAVIIIGQQVSATEWMYTVTYEPLDNYAVCPPPGNVATITLTGLSGVTSATAPTSTDIDTVTSDPTIINFFNSINLAWVPEVLNGGTAVRWTHLGPGTGNWSVPLHVFGFKVVTAAPAQSGTVNVASDGFSVDVSVSGPCPVQPAADRDFIGTTEGPVGATILEVSIDIKPGSFPNSVNPGSKGVIPVAILTTETFDATAVDPSTVFFGSTGTETAPVHFAWEDVDGDGDIDLILHFKTQATRIQCGDRSASITGKTYSGQMIQGADSVKTVGCK